MAVNPQHNIIATPQRDIIALFLENNMLLELEINVESIPTIALGQYAHYTEGIKIVEMECKLVKHSDLFGLQAIGPAIRFSCPLSTFNKIIKTNNTMLWFLDKAKEHLASYIPQWRIQDYEVPKPIEFVTTSELISGYEV